MMMTDIEIAKQLGYTNGVSETCKKVDEVLDRIPWTMETSELRREIRNVMMEMLVKAAG